MAELHQHCCICGKTFHVQFSYQTEQQRDEDGAEGHRYFCSQACLAQSHRAAITCNGCHSPFAVTHASQVLFLNGQRRYACSEGCRKHLLAPAPMQAKARASTAPAVTSQQASRLTSQQPEPSDNLSAEGPQIMAVFNHKGGTGKTTTAVTLAAGLAKAGRRTLLVDTDAQGNVAVSLGIQSPARSLYHVLVMGMPVEQAVVQARPNLDVLCANETLAAAELYLAGRQNRDRVLATRLASARQHYDSIVVDCSPSLSLLNQNALVFSSSVLCPVACDYLSLVGVRQVVKTIKNVNRLLAHPVALWGVLPTHYDRRARICNEALETLREHFQERCLSPIRAAIRVKEAPSQGKTLFEYDPDSDVAKDYWALVERVSRASAPAPQSAEPLMASA
jgi:chromosome partitioning protein